MTDTEAMIAITLPVWAWTAFVVLLAINTALKALTIYYDRRLFKKRVFLLVLKEIQSELKKMRQND